MKVVKFCIAGVAAIWTAIVAVGVASNAIQHGGTRGLTELAGGCAAIAIASLVTYWLFEWARGGPQKPPESPDVSTDIAEKPSDAGTSAPLRD
jgi:hypothetical protein